MKKTINIEGMNCGHCSASVTRALSEIKGVTDVAVSLEDKKAVIDSALEIPNETLIEAIEDAGYEVLGIE